MDKPNLFGQEAYTIHELAVNLVSILNKVEESKNFSEQDQENILTAIRYLEGYYELVISFGEKPADLIRIWSIIHNVKL